MNTKCPNCGGEMKSGTVEVHGTALGFFIIGFSYQNLYFKADGEKEIMVLGSKYATSAKRCDRCGSIIIDGNKNYSALDFDEEEFVKTTRKLIVDTLRFCASRETQEKFVVENPDLNIGENVFISWNDNYNPEMKDFTDSFTIEELEYLDSFNNVIQSLRQDKMENTDLFNSEKWSDIVSIAERVVDKIKIE